MKNILLIIIISTFLFSCKKEAVEKTNEENFEVELLFEKDGCKVYRFYDCGNYIYYSDCRGKINYEYIQHHGKTTSTHNVETLNN